MDHLRALQQLRARARQAHTAPVPHEERRAEFGFELGDLAA
jgi:hypothetical protein